MAMRKIFPGWLTHPERENDEVTDGEVDERICLIWKKISLKERDTPG